MGIEEKNKSPLPCPKTKQELFQVPQVFQDSKCKTEQRKNCPDDLDDTERTPTGFLFSSEGSKVFLKSEDECFVGEHF